MASPLPPPSGKVFKNNLTYKEKFKINLQNRFNNLQPKDTKAAGTSRTNTTKNTTLISRANNPGVKNLPPPVFLKYTKDHIIQMKTLNDMYPELRSKLTGEYYEDASRPITNRNYPYTPQHIQNLIRQKNKARKTVQNTLNPIHKTNYN
ncbi:hypothetical protein TNCV_4021801 [Trichonephila clavipes]|nr:hypothetical protein TNCV_4021801 [Trichonephila clavipes]